jgi:2-keto-4-pentenoate hydratase/2-oxohepta-3-ene-1,7-dioic acid hydratase in catechol pathway
MEFVLNPFGIFARTVYCVGRNYAAHAKEMKAEVPRAPVLFLKPVSALVHSGRKIVLPSASRQVDHEVEVVVALAGGGKNIPVEKALDFVAGYGVGIDVTARDLQEGAKKAGLPWTVAKGFDTFAPLSDFQSRSQMGDGPFEFKLSVNGTVRQEASTREMIFSFAELIHYLSTIFTLNTGDLIFTGTPSGVGPLVSGDDVLAELGSLRLAMHVE